MSSRNAENYLVLLANSDFSVAGTGEISDNLKNELIGKVFPSGSKWRLYTGIRSIAFFPLQSMADRYALSYSVILDIVDTPIISYVAILDDYHAQLILSHGLRGIENAFLRKLGVFITFANRQTNILRENIVFYKSSSINKLNGKITGQAKHNQIIFTSACENFSQWIEVETEIIKTAVPSNKKRMFSFRTFTLNQEPEFEILGLVQG